MLRRELRHDAVIASRVDVVENATAGIARTTAVKTLKTTTPAKARKHAPESEPKPYHHGNLRESLLEAADSVLAREGALGITLREVANEAGVSHAATSVALANMISSSSRNSRARTRVSKKGTSA